MQVSGYPNKFTSINDSDTQAHTLILNDVSLFPAVFERYN